MSGEDLEVRPVAGKEGAVAKVDELEAKIRERFRDDAARIPMFVCEADLLAMVAGYRQMILEKIE